MLLVDSNDRLERFAGSDSPRSLSTYRLAPILFSLTETGASQPFAYRFQKSIIFEPFSQLFSSA